jgi:hypothetical protein
MEDVVHAECPAFAVFEPFLGEFVAVYVEVSCYF